jgi:acyl carrier protein
MLDSYDILMLVAELDKNYGISIAGVDILPENLRNIASIEKLLAKYVAKS